MLKPVVLITSATSRNGTEAAKLLLKSKSYTVRLAARDPTKLAATLVAAEGAETVALDPTSAESMIQACSGVDFVYLILPSLVNGADTVMFRNFLQAAESTGVRHIVYLSAMDAARASSAEFHHHYEHEQKLLRSGIPFTSLRPTWFHENLVAVHAEPIRRTGEFRTSAGGGVWTSVAVGDIAAAAVAVLSDPGRHAGKLYTLETEAVTEQVVAEKISRVARRTVAHVNLTPEEHAGLIREMFRGSPNVEEYVGALVSLDRVKRSSQFSVVHPDLEQLLGHKGLSLDDFLAQHADAFKPVQEAS